MDVWKMAGVCEFTQPLVCQTSLFARCSVCGLMTPITRAHRRWASVKFAGLRFLQGLLNGHVRANTLWHRASHEPLGAALPAARLASAVDASWCARTVDRLLLESRGNEKSPVGNHQRHDDRIISRNLEIITTEVIGARTIPANAVPIPKSA